MCDCCCDKKQSCCVNIMDDCLARKVECIFKKTFCDAEILPCIGLPSNNSCVMTLMHKLSQCAPCLKINGLTTKSLANHSFYSGEVSCGQWLNLYQVNLPNVAGKCGCKSSSDIYTEALVKMGISIDSLTVPWKGACPDIVTVHSKAIGMHPVEFAKKQTCALKSTLDYLSKKCC